MSEKVPILHIVVVGFHHKKGCQVEFSHPPLIAGTEGKNECPSGWKYFPTLALPDGSHNYASDTVFFNLPSLDNPTESVYGVSCFKQIPVEKLKNRTADVTRSTVQKSVCVLTSLPIYGYIEVKLSLIADAFFDQGDFSYTELLVNAYSNLNACLLDEPNPMRHFDVGLSLRDIVLKWRHKTLILFKLFLLQKRVVCFGSPVRSMCTLIMGIASLYPRLIEKGFQEVACVQTSRPMSPMPDFNPSPKFSNVEDNNENSDENKNGKHDDSSESCSENKSPTSESSDKSVKDLRDLMRTNSTEIPKRPLEHLHRDASFDTLASVMFPLASINPDSYNAPIPIFSSGHLCFPYLSLPYLDLLTDPSVLSYVIGTSNVLFQQKKNLADIHVDIENAILDTNDQDLRRQLALSTEDLRFVDYILKHVQSPKEDAEGSEHWIREQYQGYILALMKTTVAPENQKDVDHFNASFISAFKRTDCFSEWYEKRPDEGFFEAITSGHPFSGTLSVADMKLKLAQTMNNSESGRKINQAVNTTSRAVGGALSTAKGAFSNWWSSMTTQNNLNQEKSFQSDNICDVNYDEDDENEINNIRNEKIIEKIESCQEISEVEIKEEISLDNINEKTEGIVEIGKEAELLDNKQTNGKIFTV